MRLHLEGWRRTLELDAAGEEESSDSGESEDEDDEHDAVGDWRVEGTLGTALDGHRWSGTTFEVRLLPVKEGRVNEAE